jgi:hypothetical protein
MGGIILRSTGQEKAGEVKTDDACLIMRLFHGSVNMCISCLLPDPVKSVGHKCILSPKNLTMEH